MKSSTFQACEAWKLLIQLFFEQRADLPAVAAEFDLSPAQCHLLHLMEAGQPIPMGRVADALACDASNVTGLVDRLESRGLVRRKSLPEDRRVKVLELTPAGARIRATVLERMTEPPESFARLSPGEQRAMVKILKRLLDQRSRS